MTTTVDGTQLYEEAIQRIRQLEALNATLAAQVDRMRPVVDAAITWLNDNSGDSEITNRLIDETDQYEQWMAHWPGRDVVDKTERARYKQLALDTIVSTGVHSPEAQLAEALERCVDELEDANSQCPTCSVCENHGDYELDEDELP